MLFSSLSAEDLTQNSLLADFNQSVATCAEEVIEKPQYWKAVFNQTLTAITSKAFVLLR
jgi:hypothetical protein